MASFQGDVNGAEALLSVQNEFEALVANVVMKLVQGIRREIVVEITKLDGLIGFPKQNDSDRVTAHHGIKKQTDAANVPNEVALNSRKNDFFRVDFVNQLVNGHLILSSTESSTAL